MTLVEFIERELFRLAEIARRRRAPEVAEEIEETVCELKERAGREGILL